MSTDYTHALARLRVVRYNQAATDWRVITLDTRGEWWATSDTMTSADAALDHIAVRLTGSASERASLRQRLILAQTDAHDILRPITQP